jgi:hypothetical protein
MTDVWNAFSRQEKKAVDDLKKATQQQNVNENLKRKEIAELQRQWDETKIRLEKEARLAKRFDSFSFSSASKMG